LEKHFLSGEISSIKLQKKGGGGEDSAVLAVGVTRGLRKRRKKDLGLADLEAPPLQGTAKDARKNSREGKNRRSPSRRRPCDDKRRKMAADRNLSDAIIKRTARQTREGKERGKSDLSLSKPEENHLNMFGEAIQMKKRGGAKAKVPAFRFLHERRSEEHEPKAVGQKSPPRAKGKGLLKAGTTGATRWRAAVRPTSAKKTGGQIPRISMKKRLPPKRREKKMRLRTGKGHTLVDDFVLKVNAYPGKGKHGPANANSRRHTTRTTGSGKRVGNRSSTAFQKRRGSEPTRHVAATTDNQSLGA